MFVIEEAENNGREDKFVRLIDMVQQQERFWSYWSDEKEELSRQKELLNTFCLYPVR